MVIHLSTVASNVYLVINIELHILTMPERSQGILNLFNLDAHEFRHVHQMDGVNWESELPRKRE